MSKSHSREIKRSISFLYDSAGRRKYLTPRERERFLKNVAKQRSLDVQLFCLLLAYTGARLSEILTVTLNQVDFEAEVLVIQTLKKRNRFVYRAVPLPPSVLAKIHHLFRMKKEPVSSGKRLFAWSRTTAWVRIKEVMGQCGIDGPQASPKGLRHGFAVYALLSGAPPDTGLKMAGAFLYQDHGHLHRSGR